LKVNYDKETDILYPVIKKGATYDSQELDDDLRVEYDKEGRIAGIEIFDARKSIGKAMAEEIARHRKAIPA
jgi:uncharacterized protein YuzE